MAAKRAAADDTMQHRQTKWVVCVDGSAVSQRAFDWTVNCAAKTDSIVVLAVVEPVRQTLPHPSAYFLSVAAELNKENEQHARATLDSFAQRAAAAGAHNVTTQLRTANSAKEEICRFVEVEGADNVVLGRRGLTDAEKLVLGSTSDYCMRHAHANIVVIK